MVGGCRSTPYYPQIDLNHRRVDPTVIFRRNPTPYYCLSAPHPPENRRSGPTWLVGQSLLRVVEQLCI